MLGVHRQSRQVGTEDAVLVQLTELAGVLPVLAGGGAVEDGIPVPYQVLIF